MTKIIIDGETKKATVENMSGGDVFICNCYYYMFVNLDTIVRLSDFTIWDVDDFDNIEYIIYDTEIVIHK